MKESKLEDTRTRLLRQLAGPLPWIGLKARVMLLMTFALVYVGDCIRYHVDSIQTRTLENDDEC